MTEQPNCHSRYENNHIYFGDDKQSEHIIEKCMCCSDK